MRWRLVKLSLSLLLLLGAGSLRPGQANGDSYTGLDIVFLVDQSGSMGGAAASSPSHPQANDTLGLRFSGLQFAAQLLGSDRLLIHPNITYRMSVVYFGSAAQPLTFSDAPPPGYWEVINPSTRADWEPSQTVILDTLSGESTRGAPGGKPWNKTNLGETNFTDAFATALDLFRDIPAAPGPRQQAIVLLTDGLPSLEGQAGPQLLDEVQDMVRQNFAGADDAVYVIAINDNQANYWPLIETKWERITGDPCTSTNCPDPARDRASKVASEPEIGLRFQKILADLTRDFSQTVSTQSGQVAIGPFIVPPFLQAISFTFFKADPDETLDISTPAGSVDLATDPKVIVEGPADPIETIRVLDPAPGEWQIQTLPQSPDVQITYQWIVAKGILRSPAGKQLQYVPLTLEYAMLNSTGDPLPVYADPRYQLVVTATLQADGQSWPVSLDHIGNNVYSGQFTPISTLTHTLHVLAASQDAAGKPITVFDGDVGQFDVVPAQLAVKNLPQRWPQYQPLTVTYQLVGGGLPISPTVPIDVIVSIADEAGEPFALTAKPGGLFEGTYVPEQPGSHTLHVTANLIQPDGASLKIADEDSGTFDVTPTVQVNLVVVQPTVLTQTTTGLFPWDQHPVELEVQLQDQNGQTVDPLKAFATDPVQAVAVTVYDAELKDRSSSLKLQPSAAQAIYRARTNDLGMGEYDLTIKIAGTFNPGFVPGTAKKPFHLVRVRNPGQIPALLALLAALVLAAGTTYGVRRHRKAISAHPCRGSLYILDVYGAQEWREPLDPYARNRIEFGKDKFARHLHITKMVVECNSEKASQEKDVQVTIWLDGERVARYRREILKAGRYDPNKRGSKLQLRPYDYWLLKDPIDEQFRDRSPGGRDLSISKGD